MWVVIITARQDHNRNSEISKFKIEQIYNQLFRTRYEAELYNLITDVAKKNECHRTPGLVAALMKEGMSFSKRTGGFKQSIEDYMTNRMNEVLT